mgnify:FL=1
MTIDGPGGSATQPLERADLIGRVVHALAPWALGLGTIVGFAASPRHPPYPIDQAGRLPWPVAAGLVLVAAIAAGRARRRQGPLRVAAALSWLSLSMWVPAMAVGYYTVVSGRPGRGRVVRVTLFVLVTAGAVAVPLAADRLRTGRGGPVEAALFGAALAAAVTGPPVVLGLWVDARRQVVVMLTDRAARLERAQAARVERARTEERARIAREMHDVVAHRVSLMVLHAGALEVCAVDEPTVTGAALIRTAGREALTELRQVLGVLRSFGDPDGAPGAPAGAGPLPTLADLDGLLDRVGACGVPVEQRHEGDPPAAGYPPAVQRAAYRAVREALTNVARHAGAAATTVALRHRPDALEVEVTNVAPVGPRPVPAPGGLGLVGLAERVGVLGGSVTAGTTAAGGFGVLVRIPTGPGSGD